MIAERQGWARPRIRSLAALGIGLVALTLAWWPLAQSWAEARAAGPVIADIEAAAGEPFGDGAWINYPDDLFTGDPVDGRALHFISLRAIVSVAIATTAAFAVAWGGWRNQAAVGLAVAAPLATLIGWTALLLFHGETIGIVDLIME